MGELGFIALPIVSYLILYLYEVGIYLSVGGSSILAFPLIIASHKVL